MSEQDEKVKAASTPTPWQCDINETCVGCAETINKDDGQTLQYVAHVPFANGKGFGNARLIVAAVNAHDDLVQACKAWMEVSDLLDISASLLATPQGIQTLAIARLNARDALAKLENK